MAGHGSHDGRILWQRKFGTRVYSTKRCGPHVIVARMDADVGSEAIEGNTGRTLWRTKEGVFETDAKLARGLGWRYANDGTTFTAIDCETGKVVWTSESSFRHDHRVGNSSELFFMIGRSPGASSAMELWSLRVADGKATRLLGPADFAAASKVRPRFRGGPI